MQCDKAFRRDAAVGSGVSPKPHYGEEIAKRIGGPRRTRIRVENAAVGSGAPQAGQRKACRRTILAHALQTNLATS